jgi:plastocyanin
MRKAYAALAAALVVAMVAFLALPGRVTAQAGGTLEVEVRHDGPPAAQKFRIARDPKACGTEATVETISVGPTKGLANVAVTVPTAQGGAKPAKNPEMDQRGCMFKPRVVTMAPGALDFLNNDGILHNVHTYSTANPAINKAQPRFRKVLTEKFDKPEVIKVTCDVHSWMTGWIVVAPTNFHGVTGPEGVVKLENVPAGKHTVEVWHEELGTQRQEVEVKPGQTTKVRFEMKKS